ncbi:MAG: hypothetical protein LAP38_26695 [Acidobacteriia bacterium]|nr:hypothetical protein [Terriglobia bacterium]
MPRVLLAFSLLVVSANAQVQPERPKWLDDRSQFCAELAERTNRGPLPTLRNPKSIDFEQYKVRPIASPRSDEAVIGKDVVFDDRLFGNTVKAEAAKGPDFAGRYAVVLWTCGTWCTNATIADVRTARTVQLPFAGVIGCERVTGEHRTIERKADSRLMIVRGSLEIPNGDYLDEGPCGTFYYVWQQRRLRLIGCKLSEE